MEKPIIIGSPASPSSSGSSSDIIPVSKKRKVECIDITEEVKPMQTKSADGNDSALMVKIQSEVDVSDLDGYDSDAETVCHSPSPQDDSAATPPRPDELLALTPATRYDDRARELFAGSDRSVDEAVLDMFANHIRHRGTDESLSAQLQTFVKYLPQPNNMPKTVEELFGYVHQDFPIITRRYCTACLKQQCDCEASYMYWFDVREQVKHYFECCDLASVIDEYRRKESKDSYCDIRDGSEYEKSRFGQYDLVLLWNCDGVRMKNSDQCMFLSQAVVCEVPPHLRHKYKLILWLWWGEKRPPFETLLFPFVENMKDLNENLVRWIHPNGEENMSLVVAPAVCTSDYLRDKLQGVQNACNTCEQRPVANIKDVPVFDYLQSPARLREHRRMVVLSQVANPGDTSIVKSIPCIDLASSFYPEYVSTALGVTRHFLVIWLEAPGTWSKNLNIADLDAKVRNIKLTNEGNPPPPLSMHEEWTTWDYHRWLLLYSLPLCRLFLPKEYLDHWSLLVQAIFLLLKCEVTRQDAQTAQKCLNSFVEQIETLYNKNCLIRCVHNLLHLPQSVERWGPLCFTSAFQFYSLKRIVSNLLQTNSTEIASVMRIAYGMDRMNIPESDRCALQKIFCLDPISMRSLKECEQKLVADAVIATDADHMKIFARAKVGNAYYTSQVYEEKGNNSTVAFKKLGQLWFGEIVCFVDTGLLQTELKAIIKVFFTERRRIFGHPGMDDKVDHIIRLRGDGKFRRFDLVPVDAICEKLVRVEDFVCRLPNVKA